MLHQVEVTPTLDTAQYAAGDHMSDVATITVGCTRAAVAKLQSLIVHDKSDQGVAFDVLFFKSSPTVASAKNDALSVTDAEMDKYIGHVRLAADDFIDTGAQKIACLKDIELPLKCDSDGKIYALLLSQGTGTYAAAGLVLKATFEFEG